MKLAPDEIINYLMNNNNNYKNNRLTLSTIVLLICTLLCIVNVLPYSLCTTSISSCLICPIQCKKCSSPLTCTQCSPQFYLSTTTCLPCSSYCLTCTSSTQCTSCQSPYVLSSSTKTCLPCVINNALQCSSTVSASVCEDKYYVNQNYCSSCLLNCKTCTSSSTCTECMQKYYLNSTVLTCNPCANNCIKCNTFNPNNCTTCDKGYLLDTSIGTCNLITCDITNCIYCSNDNICARCQQYYYYNNTSCIMGASVLCQYGSIGPLPSHCINQCSQLTYKSQSTTLSPFLCVPYRYVNLEDKNEEFMQMYYYAYSAYQKLRILSGTNNNVVLQSNEQYSYSLNKLMFNTLVSYYKILIKIKYISSNQITLNLSALSQAISSTSSSYQLQSQNKSLPLSYTPLSLSFSTLFVHSNNLNLAFSSSINLIQLYLIISTCSSSCLQCLNQQLCQYCIQPFYMLGYKCVNNCTIYYHFALNRTCLLNCPDQYYYQNNGTNQKYCQLCVSPCGNCIDQNKCLTCINGYYFYNYTCKITCLDGYFKNTQDNLCEKCISPCNTCINKTTCLSCELGFWNGVQCTNQCINGKFGNNITKTCDNCSNNCLTCTNSSTTCTSCTPLLHLHNRKCISTCPQTYYSSSSTPLLCLRCIPPCQTCLSQSSCLTCSYNYFYSSSCISTCPASFFNNLANNTCTLCSSSCKTCSSLNVCTSCPLTSECLYQGICVTSCPSNQWYKLINSTSDCTCTQCKYPCKSCLSELSCLSCLQGYLYETECLTECHLGYYKNTISKQCTLCSNKFTNCQQCTHLKCTLCSSNYYLFNGTCLLSCPSLYYPSNLYCNKCIAPCLQCQSFVRCTSCIQNYIFYQNKCITSCPNGKYIKNSTSTSLLNPLITTYSLSCQPCTSPCLYCQSSPSKCILCISQYYLFNSSCLSSCSSILPISTYYNQVITSTCSKCLFPCKTCLSQYSCKSCMIGYLNTEQNKCEQCSIGTYPNNTLMQCIKCPIQCMICYSNTFCTICNDGYYLYENMCISNITICENNGYYAIGRVCTLCSQPCKTCTQSAQNCTTCLSGYILFDQHQCILECPIGYYRNPLTSLCQLCALQCLSCMATSTYCFSCKIGYKLYTAQMACVSTCPKQSYTEGSFCTSCKYPCLQCLSETSCQSCISGSLIVDKCYSSCSQGYFSNSLNICEQCVSPCKQCSNSNKNCTQCITNTYLHNNKCVQTCPSSTFGQKQSLKCIKCLGTCYQCQNHINCTSCKDNLYFYISTTTGYGQCVTTCPNGYYPQTQQKILNKCLPCNSQCLTCEDKLSCLLCNDDKVMLNGSCLIRCPQKMYNYQGVCESCQQPCYNCSDTTTCTSCFNNSFLLVGSAQCIQGPTCPVGYFLLENQPKCNSQCPILYYHLTTNRTCNKLGCEENKFKGLDYQCYSRCPENYIANQSLFCIPCSGDQCYDGLFYQLDYWIKNDQLIVYLEFTQSPVYIIQKPKLRLSPQIQYSISQFYHNKLVSSSSNVNPFTGQRILTLTLNPSTSLQQTYFSVQFTSFLQTFSNPLQHSSSYFYLKGYDKYNNSQLMTLTFSGIFTLLCAVIGLIKTPYMTDYAQVLFIVGLSNIHYPLHLRSYLENTGLAWLNRFVEAKKNNVEGKGKFKYVVDNGLLSNSMGNILIVIIGLVISIIGFVIMKILKLTVQYEKVQKSSSYQQSFINKNNNAKNTIKPSQQNQQIKQQKKQSRLSIEFLKFLQYYYQFPQLSQQFKHKSGIYNLIILFINRFIYFNYLPICLFSMTQLQSFDTSDSLNLISSFLSILFIILCIIYPFYLTLRIKKQKYTFLYIKKLSISFSLILSINYPAYCIGVISICAIMTGILILAYKLQKWKWEYRVYAVNEFLQFVLMVLLAIFIMIGEGYKTQFKVYFAWLIIVLSVIILFNYVLFSIFMFVVYIISKINKINYIQQWIDQDKNDDSDGTDSQTMNSSMKDHQEKKKVYKQNAFQQKYDKETLNNNQIPINTIQQFFRTTNNLTYKNRKDLTSTNQIGISPSKNNLPEQLYWNYGEGSQNTQNQNDKDKDKQPPKMLIRCVNDFSDFDQDQIKQQNNKDMNKDEKQNNTKNKKHKKKTYNNKNN